MAQPREPLTAERPPPAPLWVKLSAALVIALLLIVVVLHLSGNAPGMHGGHMPQMQHSGQHP